MAIPKPKISIIRTQHGSIYFAIHAYTMEGYRAWQADTLQEAFRLALRAYLGPGISIR